MTIIVVVKRAVVIAVEALEEIRALPPRFRKPVVRAIDELEHQADVTSKHRHAMAGAFEPHWQVEVGEHRVYYLFDAQTVTVKAVRRKGNRRTEEVFKP